jgi:hypothetical protein
MQAVIFFSLFSVDFRNTIYIVEPRQDLKHALGDLRDAVTKRDEHPDETPVNTWNDGSHP